MRNLFTLLAGLALATTAFGFNEGKPAGAEFYGEQNQEQLAQQQAFNQKYEVNGEVPRDTEMQSRTPQARPDHSAGATLNLVAQREAARRNVAKAHSQRVAAPAAPANNWLRFLVLALAVGTGAYLIKRYMDIALPDAPKKKKLRW